MRLLFSLLVIGSMPLWAQEQDPHFDPAAIARVRDKVADMHGGSLNSLIMADRLETRREDGEDNLVWEAQGWIGYDINKLWLKTEGQRNLDTHDTDDLEWQALWSHAVSPFWDIQAGWRHEVGDGTRDYAVVGLMGLAPYWFEVDAAAFVSDKGDMSTRLEAEYDLRFTQRLILPPRVALNHAFSDDLAAGSGSGFSKVEAGLRLRYEFRRELAPYVGISWEKAYGDTAQLWRSQGQGTSDLSMVAGFRLWY